MIKYLFRFFCLASLVSFFAGCANPQESVLYGKVTEDWDGKQITLSNTGYNGGKLLASATIDMGKFKLKVEPDSSYIALLRIDMGYNAMPYLLPVALEPGKIEVLMGKETLVSGTPMNDCLQQFMIDKGLFVENDTVQSGSLDNFYDFIDGQIEKYRDFSSLAYFIKMSYGRR